MTGWDFVDSAYAKAHFGNLDFAPKLQRFGLWGCGLGEAFDDEEEVDLFQTGELRRYVGDDCHQVAF